MENLIFGIPAFEWVGYLASAAVLSSFLMKNIRMLRIINTVGCSLFVAYGFILPQISWPIIGTNVAIIIINAYYLAKTTKTVE
ncbi:MAG: uroporphyrinogen decarboxylase [Crocinitomicaceae bacterium]|nr:uroporphyrinogen decarboxylase [Crocinitomicaceae bacterium]